MNYSHFKIEFVFKRERIYDSFKKEMSYNFDYEFTFGEFKGLFVVYCNSNDYSIKPKDVEEAKKDYKFLIPLNRNIDSNYFKAIDQFTFRPAKGSVNLYLIPFGNLIEDYFTLKLEVKQFEFSEASITIHPSPNKPNSELSTKLHYSIEPGRESFYKVINSEDCSEKIVVNQLSRLPILLGEQELLYKAPVDKIRTLEKKRTLEKIETLNEVSKIQNRVHTTIANLNELMKMLDEILKELIEIKEDTQKIGDIASIIEGIDIKADLNMFIKDSKDLKKDLTKYIKTVLENGWPEDKKDLWAKVMINILENWKAFEKKKWKRIVIGIANIAVGELAAEIGSDLISSGMNGLFDWIKKIKKEYKSTQ